MRVRGGFMHLHNELLATDIPRRNMYLFPNKTAIVFQGRRISHLEFYARTNRLANGLMGMGLVRGGRCAILAMNRGEYLECFFGIPKAGGIFLPLNYRLAPDELVYILNDSGAGILIYEKRFEDVIERIRSRVSVRTYIAVGGSSIDGIEYDDLLSRSSEEESGLSLNGLRSEDEFCLMYTSGTTGFPKGVLLTQRNMIANMWGVQVAYRCTNLDVHLAIMPLYHAGSLQYSAVHYGLGGTVVILERFDVGSFFRAVEEEKVTTTFIVSSQLQHLANEVRANGHDLRSLRLIFYGASGISRDQLREALRTFNCDFTQGYGMTELGPRGVTYFTLEDHRAAMKDPEKEHRFTSCGVVTPSIEVKVVDESDRTLGPGRTGELCVRGEPVFKCYWNAPKETEEALRGGWFHTGDLGYFDEDGFFYIVGRKKDMIISGGENIYPAEVEKVICSHPSVLECAVFGLPDPQWGESICAMVALKKGMRATAGEIVDHCKEHLASYKKPKRIEFIKEIPRNAMGKVIKRELRKEILERVGEGDRTADKREGGRMSCGKHL
ncbi:MAG: long-chain-fatty-acid--CoA ligase [Desulfobacteraceae bacterium]|nr:MAG: long-chain-fatty-acid--CoA ligase [Desulfobacteraceae bacterium]